jgi:hypothetical protein
MASRRRIDFVSRPKTAGYNGDTAPRVGRCERPGKKGTICLALEARRTTLDVGNVTREMMVGSALTLLGRVCFNGQNAILPLCKELEKRHRENIIGGWGFGKSGSDTPARQRGGVAL